MSRARQHRHYYRPRRAISLFHGIITARAILSALPRHEARGDVGRRLPGEESTRQRTIFGAGRAPARRHAISAAPATAIITPSLTISEKGNSEERETRHDDENTAQRRLPSAPMDMLVDFSSAKRRADDARTELAARRKGQKEAIAAYPRHTAPSFRADGSFQSADVPSGRCLEVLGDGLPAMTAMPPSRDRKRNITARCARGAAIHAVVSMEYGLTTTIIAE